MDGSRGIKVIVTGDVLVHCVGPLLLSSTCSSKTVEPTKPAVVSGDEQLLSLPLSSIMLRQASVRLKPSVSIAVPNPGFAVVLNLGRGRLELPRMNVYSWPAAYIRILLKRSFAGEAHATHRASLQTILDLVLPIGCFVLACTPFAGFFLLLRGKWLTRAAGIA
jgi:hypothetical protein